MGEYFERSFIQAQKGFHRIGSIKPDQSIPGGMRFLCEDSQMDITFFAPGVIRFQCKAGNSFDYGLLTADAQQINPVIKTVREKIMISSGDVIVEISIAPFSFNIRKKGRLILESTTDCSMEGPNRFHPFARSTEHGWQVSLALKSGEPIYGLGEKFGRLNHRGELITNWNRDALGVNAEYSYKNVPFAWSGEGWGFFVNTPSKVTHAIGYSPWSHRSYIAQVADSELDLFFILGDTPNQIINTFTNFTGKSPSLPLWSYGLWMSRAYYQTAEALLDVVKEMRARHIPLDVIVLDGRAWHKPETRFDFSWDPDRYPDPKSFMKQLKEQNVRLCLWEYPYISTYNPLFNELANKNYLLKTSDGQPYIHQWLPEPYELSLPQLCPSGLIDFTNPDAYDWYLEQHKALFDLGVAVMKTDFGEAVPAHVVAFNGDSGARLHNVYARLYNQCVYEASQRYGKDEALVWGRAGWTGSQRFPLGWGGDPQSDWEGLAASIRGGQAWGMSGVPFYAHDIGGWYGNLNDPELFVRWTQAGVMTSHMRFHGIGPREPWIFGRKIEKIITKWINWRYQLIPYLRFCESEARLNGMPVMRSMALAFPEDRAAWSFEEQYMLGPSLLVAPVLQAGGRVEVYLPKGTWYNIWSGKLFKGGSVFIFEDVPLDEIPIFGRAGYWLPLGPIVESTDELNGNILIEEIWTFGELLERFEMHTEQLKLQNVAGEVTLSIPGKIKVKKFQ